MKKSFLHIILLLAGFVFLSSNEVFSQQFLLNYFTVNSEGADIKLEWEAQSEKGVLEYQVYRKFNNEPVLKHLATISPDQSNKYEFLDDDIFKDNSKVINYELHVITEDQVFKFYTSLSHNPTSIQRTWGSIKSMFR